MADYDKRWKIGGNGIPAMELSCGKHCAWAKVILRTYAKSVYKRPGNPIVRINSTVVGVEEVEFEQTLILLI